MDPSRSSRPTTLLPGRTRRRVLRAGAVSLVAWALLEILAPRPLLSPSPAMEEAARRMEAALEVMAEHCRREGIEVDPGTDPAGTCLVGPELTPLFTTLGHLEAKRTTTNPAWAALLAHLLRDGAVGRGDTVAVGASGSFPALAVATLVAVEALGAHPRAILSLGASSYGATRPDLHLLDLHRLLVEEGVLSTPPVAVSPGGGRDVGAGMEEAFLEPLLAEVRASSVPLILEDDLAANVARRMEMYGVGEGEPGRRVSAFVNVGGAWANLGTSSRILRVEPGLHTDLARTVSLPPRKRRGVLFEMAAQGVPVVHLLYVRGLAERYGLPWDPVPLPRAREQRLANPEAVAGLPFWLVTAGYVAALTWVVFGVAKPEGGRAVH
mgnify:CR=1 FL=1